MIFKNLNVGVHPVSIRDIAHMEIMAMQARRM